MQWEIGSAEPVGEPRAHAMTGELGTVGVEVTSGVLTTYVTMSSTAIIRVTPPTATTLLQSGRLETVVVAGDAIWFARTLEGRSWLASLPKSGGPAVNLVELNGDPLIAPVPTNDAVWYFDMKGESRSWSLYRVPKAGGARVRPLRWLTKGGKRVYQLPVPIWTASNDEAWIFIDDEIMHVQMQ
jgi:hypothetical protein